MLCAHEFLIRQDSKRAAFIVLGRPPTRACHLTWPSRDCPCRSCQTGIPSIPPLTVNASGWFPGPGIGRRDTTGAAHALPGGTAVSVRPAPSATCCPGTSETRTRFVRGRKKLHNERRTETPGVDRPHEALLHGNRKRDRGHHVVTTCCTLCARRRTCHVSYNVASASYKCPHPIILLYITAGDRFCIKSTSSTPSITNLQLRDITIELFLIVVSLQLYSLHFKCVVTILKISLRLLINRIY